MIPVKLRLLYVSIIKISGKNDTIEMKQNQVYGFINGTKTETKEESIYMKCNQVYGLTSGSTFKKQEKDIDKNYYTEVDIPRPGQDIHDKQ